MRAKGWGLLCLAVTSCGDDGRTETSDEAQIGEASGAIVYAKDVAPITRVEGDTCTVSADTSGEPLHRRGYRQEVSRAPLRETLAAGILVLAGYDGVEPLVDPMCGSGTFLIEGAWMSQRRAPGLQRAFAFESQKYPRRIRRRHRLEQSRTEQAQFRRLAVLRRSDQERL